MKRNKVRIFVVYYINMNGRISLDIDTGELTKVTYDFYLLDGVLYLDVYREWEKSTKRSGYKFKRGYDRLNERDSHFKESEVPLTDEIKKEALKEFISKLSVKKWSERGK